MNKLTNESFINAVRTKIKSDKTFESSYYGDIFFKEDKGTTHLSVLANGDAVSLSSTINL